jgi:HEAT repeat protein
MRNDQYDFGDETITLAAGMSDEQRLRLIAKAIATDTAQSHRIAELLMAVHLHERGKARKIVEWALGTTLH